MAFRTFSWRMVLRKSSKIGSTRSAFTTGLTTCGRQTLFLCFHYPVKLRLCILDFQMRVGSKSNPDVRMTHDILQGFGIHAAVRHVGTEDVAAHMRGDFRKLYFVDAAVPVYRQRYLPSVRWYSPSRKIRFRLSCLFSLMESLLSRKESQTCDNIISQSILSFYSPM